MQSHTKHSHEHGHSHQQHDDEDDFKRPEDNNPDHNTVQQEYPKSRLELANETGMKTFNQLVVASIIAVIFLGCQLYGAHWSGSIAIMSDALHLASDLIGYVVAMTAVGFSAKQSTNRLSYGWHRSELVGTLISIFSIWWMSAFLVKEAYARLWSEPEVLGGRMLIVAVIGLCFNIIQITQMLCGCGGHGHVHTGGDSHGHSHGGQDNEEVEGKAPRNMNLEGAILHVVGDLLSSFGVVIASIVIYFKPEWWWCDPICTFIFAVLVFATTIGLFKRCMFIIMESCPENIDFDAVQEELYQVAKASYVQGKREKNFIDLGVRADVHDLHIWGISSDKIALTCHLRCAKPMQTLRKANDMLEKKFGISHATISVEDIEDAEYVKHGLCMTEDNNIHEMKMQNQKTIMK